MRAGHADLMTRPRQLPKQFCRSNLFERPAPIEHLTPLANLNVIMNDTRSQYKPWYCT